MILIGGQSQSTVLEGKNLRVVSQGEGKTKSEGYLLAMTYKALEGVEKIIRSHLRRLHGPGKQKRVQWANIEKYLARKYPQIHAQFSRVDENNFTLVGRDPFDIWIGEQRAATLEQLEEPEPMSQILTNARRDIQSLSMHHRHRLVKYWTEKIVEETTDELFESMKDAEALRQQITNVHEDVDRRVLQTADVIGITTTGLARKVATLQHMKCKVIICEEAGEVMEAHILSTLLPSVEHVIQIGDHQQLRPQINNYRLSLESQQGIMYQLDRSQLERLSVGEPGRPPFPLAQLNIQRRMRPEISTLIRETIYPRLIDHETTRNLPDVVDMRKNVFWLDHDNTEEGGKADVHQKSHSNNWEVDMTHAFVGHIVRQGVYKSSDISVLTPYTGQLQKLRATMRNDFEVVLSERDQETLAKEGFIVEEISENELTQAISHCNQIAMGLYHVLNTIQKKNSHILSPFDIEYMVLNKGTLGCNLGFVCYELPFQL